MSNKITGTRIAYASKEKKIQNKNDRFLKKELSWDDVPLFFPPGLEKLFLLIYFVTLPYIAGLLFLYFYVSEGKKETFLAVNTEGSFLLVWAIGYEIIATFILLWIVKSAITFTFQNRQKNKKNFKRP